MGRRTRKVIRVARIYLKKRGAGGDEGFEEGWAGAGEVVRADEREGVVPSGEAGAREAAAEAARGADHKDPAPRRLLGHRRRSVRWDELFVISVLPSSQFRASLK
jgi:hypothetical protein